MKLPTREPEAPEINLTPLIDVVFLMLVFFIITTTFSERDALDVTLPTAETAEPMETAPVEIVIDAAGAIQVDGETVADGAAALHRVLTEARRGRPAEARQVLIRADHRVPHGEVLAVMDQAGRNGFTEVGIATTGTDDGS